VEHPLLLPGLVFAFGLLWGSFVNVVIHRLPAGESVVWPRSRCPGCRKLIPWYRNVPVLSWLLLRGRCGDCRMRIALRYPFVELLTAALFTLVALRDPRWITWLPHFFLMAALVASTFIDLDHWLLPDKITYPGMVVGLLSSLFLPDISVLESAAGLLIGGGILYLVAWGYWAYAKKDGLGGGDIKFLAMIGAFLGPKGALATLVLSSFAGSLLGVFLILFRGKRAGTAIPFGPFLAAGALGAFFFGDHLWRWYFGSY